MPTEKVLDKALELAFKSNTEFTDWFLERTKFAGRGGVYYWSRSNNPWGHHPHDVPDGLTGKVRTEWVESETDVLVVFHARDAAPFALHIENKLADGTFMPDQSERYHSRARFWLNNPKYGPYADFQTVIVAPKIFLNRCAIDVQKFDLQVSHEEIARYVPEFGVSCYL